MQNLKKTLSTKKRLLCSKTFLQYDLLQGWDENIIYLETQQFLDLCNRTNTLKYKIYKCHSYAAN